MTGFDRLTFSANREGSNQITRIIRAGRAEGGRRSAAGSSPLGP